MLKVTVLMSSDLKQPSVMQPGRAAHQQQSTPQPLGCSTPLGMAAQSMYANAQLQGKEGSGACINTRGALINFVTTLPAIRLHPWIMKVISIFSFQLHCPGRKLAEKVKVLLECKI